MQNGATIPISEWLPWISQKQKFKKTIYYIQAAVRLLTDGGFFLAEIQTILFCEISSFSVLVAKITCRSGLKTGYFWTIILIISDIFGI
jgi:hypothetical protein